MKNLFGFDLDVKTEFTTDSPLLQPYIIRKIDDEASSTQKEISDKMEELEKKWSLSNWLVYFRAISLGIGAMLFATAIIVLLGMGKSSFSHVWFNLCFSFGLVLTFLGSALLAFEALAKKKVEKSQEYKDTVAYISTLVDKSRASLGVPEDACEVDIFFFPHTVRNGEVKDSGVFKYVNRSLRLFEEGDLLCLSDEEAVYGIEKKLFRRMLTDPKRVGFTLWNKKDSHLKEPYKSYKVSLDHYGVYHVKNVCSVQFTTHDEEKFEIVIPPYEMEHFKKILSLKIREKDEDE